MLLFGGDGTPGVGLFPFNADFGDCFCVCPADSTDKDLGCIDKIRFPEPTVGRGAGAEGFHGGKGEGRRLFRKPVGVERKIKIFLLGHSNDGAGGFCAFESFFTEGNDGKRGGLISTLSSKYDSCMICLESPEWSHTHT